MKEISAQIYRNAITFHRNQIKFCCHLSREGYGHKATLYKLAKDHAQEIKDILKDWELSYPKG